MNSVYFTSFFKAAQLPCHVVPLSCAVYQPSGFAFEKVDWTDIRHEGQWTSPRNFLDRENPIAAYRAALMRLYNDRRLEARRWANNLDSDVALCCWCPYDKAAKRQLDEFGSFVCHTAVLSEFISSVLEMPVWEDADRRRMAVLTQKHSENVYARR